MLDELFDGKTNTKKLFDILGTLKYMFGIVGMFLALLYLFSAIGIIKDLPIERNVTYMSMSIQLFVTAVFDFFLGYLFKNATKSFERWLMLLIFTSVDTLFSLIGTINLFNFNSFVSFLINLAIVICVCRVKKRIKTI